MKVLLVEATHGGHRLNIAGLLLDGLLTLPGLEITFATNKDAVASQDYKQWLEPRLKAGGVQVRTDLSFAGAGGAKTFWKLLGQVERLARGLGSEHILIPGGDGVVQVAALRHCIPGTGFRRGVEAEAMILRGKFAYLGINTAKDRLGAWLWAKAIRSSPFTRIHHMDPLIYDAAVTYDARVTRRLRRIPDPVDPIEPELTTVQARQRMNLPVEGRIVGCVGALDVRKGVDLLIRAFITNVNTGVARQDDRLLLIGKLDEIVKAALEEADARRLIESGQIIVIPRFVDDREMSNGLSAMDLVVTPYRRHVGSASIAIRAAAQRRPVLASDFGWLGEIVPRFDLGDICDIENPASFAAALATATARAPSHQPSDRGRRFIEYSSTKNFQAHWLQRCCERLGVPAPHLLTWEKAMNGV